MFFDGALQMLSHSGPGGLAVVQRSDQVAVISAYSPLTALMRVRQIVDFTALTRTILTEQDLNMREHNLHVE